MILTYGEYKTMTNIEIKELETLIECLENAIFEATDKSLIEWFESELELLQKEYLIEMQKDENCQDEEMIDEALNGDFLQDYPYL